MLQYYLLLLLMLALSTCDPSNQRAAECPDPGSKPVVEYIGRGIKLSDVVACAEINRNKSLVSILSFDNVTIDIDYSNPERESSLLLLTPALIVEGNFTFNLSGRNGASSPPKPPGNGTTHGVPGSSGRTAGSFLVAFNETNKNWNIDWLIDGGTGGDGQAGQDAPNGRDGERRQVRERDERHCSAWRGGWVKVWLEPNSCYEQMNSEGQCKANDNGARIDVYGTDGYPGYNGTNGGAGGFGGNPGVGLMAFLEPSKQAMSKTFKGKKGKSGRDGNAGNPGRGGRKGHTNELVIDDWGNIIEGKYCKILSQRYVEVNIFAREGNQGVVGGNCCASHPVPTFELEDFTPHLQSSLRTCISEAIKSDDLELMKFCYRVGEYFNL